MPLFNPAPAPTVDTSAIENRLGEISSAPTANTLSDRLVQLLARFGATADASNATGSLLARVRSLASDIAAILTAVTHPLTATRTSVTFTANTATSLATVASGVRWRTVSIRNLKTSNASVFVCLGSATATIADATLEIEAGGFYETYHLGAIGAISTGTPTAIVTIQV